jgi:hypothetical protein
VSVGALAALDERLQGMENKIAEILANAGHSSPPPEVAGPPEDITEEPPAPEPIPQDEEPEQTHWFYRRMGGRR